MSSRSGTLAIALCLALACQVRAASSPQEPVVRIADEQVDLRSLFEFLTASRGTGISFRDADLSARVMIRTGDGVTPSSLWATGNRLLHQNGFACIAVPGELTLTAVPLDKAVGLARMETDDPALAPGGFIKVLQPVRSSDPAQVADALRTVLPRDGTTITPLAETDQMLLAGLKEHVLEAIEILKRIDASEDPVLVEEYVPIHLPPVTLVTLLEQITQKSKVVEGGEYFGSPLANLSANTVLIVAPLGEVPRWIHLVSQLDKAETQFTREYVPRRFGLEETADLVEEVVGQGASAGWRVVRDELTGTLVVTGTHSEHEAVEGLFERIEAQEIQRRFEIRSFSVRHRDVDELLTLLDGLLRGAPSIPENATGGQLPEEGGEFSPPIVQALDEDVTLSVDAGTNRILAYGETRLLDQLDALITTLDVPHRQVLIEALVLSLNETETQDLGVELRKRVSRDGVLGEVGSVFGLGSPSPADTVLPPLGGSGFGGVILDPGDFSAVVSALHTVNDGRTLTMPRILVSNHEQATLDSLQKSPYIATSATTTVATTSLGGTADAGTSIAVQPHITDGDRLRLEYTISISSFTGDSVDPALPPPSQENKVQSTVLLPDGHTVVIGGLEIESDSDAASSVPVLGDLPLVGALFRSRSTSDNKTRFVVFLRCTILRSRTFEDLRYLSAPELQAAEIEPDWPVVEPRIMR